MWFRPESESCSIVENCGSLVFLEDGDKEISFCSSKNVEEAGSESFSTVDVENDDSLEERSLGEEMCLGPGSESCSIEKDESLVSLEEWSFDSSSKEASFSLSCGDSPSYLKAM